MTEINKTDNNNVAATKEEYEIMNPWYNCQNCKSKGSYVCDGCGAA